MDIFDFFSTAAVASVDVDVVVAVVVAVPPVVDIRPFRSRNWDGSINDHLGVSFTT